MLDKLKLKGAFLRYHFDDKCIIENSSKDKFSGGKIYYVKVPSFNEKEYLDVRICERLKDSRVKIEGNLRKWKYGKNSAVRDLNYIDFCSCIKLIAHRLGVEEEWVWNLEITYIEMGANIKLPRSYERFIPSLISYPELSLDRWKESTVYFHGAKYSLIFYDKLKELRDRRFISAYAAKKLIKKIFVLRFEIKINAKSGYRKKDYIQNLNSVRLNWNFLVDDWLSTFKKAKIVDLFSDSVEIKKGSMAKRQVFNYVNFLFINEIGLDRGLYYYQYFMKNRKSEAVGFIQNLYKKYKTGENWNYYENILTAAQLKAEKMKQGADSPLYNKKKTTTKIV